MASNDIKQPAIMDRASNSSEIAMLPDWSFYPLSLEVLKTVSYITPVFYDSESEDDDTTKESEGQSTTEPESEPQSDDELEAESETEPELESESESEPANPTDTKANAGKSQHLKHDKDQPVRSAPIKIRITFGNHAKTGSTRISKRRRGSSTGDKEFLEPLAKVSKKS